MDRSTALSQIGFRLQTSNTTILPVALEQTSGPFPRWRIPSIDSRIPPGLQRVHVADISEPFTLALVRDTGEDFPLLLSEPFRVTLVTTAAHPPRTIIIW